MPKLPVFLKAIVLTTYSVIACSSAALSEQSFASKYQSQMKDNTGWNRSEAIAISNGVMNVKLDSGHLVIFNQEILVNDADATIDVSFDKSDSRTEIGLIFWAKDAKSYYAFNLYPTGKFRVLRLDNEKWSVPQGDTRCPALKLGDNVWNELRVVTTGSTATLYCNGTQLTTVKGNPVEHGNLLGVYFGTTTTDKDKVKNSIAANFKGFQASYNYVP